MHKKPTKTQPYSFLCSASRIFPCDLLILEGQRMCIDRYLWKLHFDYQCFMIYIIIEKATGTKTSHLLCQLGLLHSSTEFHQQHNPCCPLCSSVLTKFYSMVKSQLTSSYLCETYSVPLRIKLLSSYSQKQFYSAKSSLLLWIFINLFIVLLPSKL